MAEAMRLERLKAMRSLLKSEMEKSESFALVLNKTGSKLEEINHKLLSLEADVKVEKWRCSPFSDHIRHTIAPISAVLRVFSSVQELERSLMSSNEVLGYVSEVKRLGEVMKLLSSSCVLALNWLDDTIEYLTEKGMPEDHPCALRFKTSIELLRELQMTEHRAYLKGGILYTVLENLKTEFKRILEEEQVLSEGNLRKLQAIIKILHAHTRLKKCVPVYIKVRTRAIQKRFEMDYLENTITEADNVHDIEGDIDQWRLHMEIAVKEIYQFESKLCYDVFEDVGEDVPLRCFGKIASNSGILSLLRFGSRISKCKKDPPKLLKLLDCFSTMDNIRIEFNQLFQGEQCSEIRRVTRELISNLVKGVCEIFWELPCQVELQRPHCPLLDGGIPRLVSVVTEYCNKLLGNNKSILSKILEIDLGWKNAKYQEELLTGHIYNILREIALNLDAWSSSNKDTALSCIFMMNNHSHFCSLRETPLGKMMGESWLNAHEKYRDYYAALYVKESWGKLLSLLTKKAQTTSSSSSSASSPVKRKRSRELIKRTLQAFSKGFDEIYTKQSNWVVEDEKLRWKICQGMITTVVPRYKNYLQCYTMLLAEEDPTSDSTKHLYYTPKGLEMKLKTMFQKREETEKRNQYSHFVRNQYSHFVNKVMDLGNFQNSHLTLEAI